MQSIYIVKEEKSVLQFKQIRKMTSSWDNHRGISLLCITGQIFASIMNNRIRPGTWPRVFNRKANTATGVSLVLLTWYSLCSRCEKSVKNSPRIYIWYSWIWQRRLILSFVTVSGAPAKGGSPDTLVSILRSFHEEMQASVIDGNQKSAPFAAKNGVKEVCLLSAVLFEIIITPVIQDAYKNCRMSVKTRYRYDSGLFKLRRLKARTKVSHALIC